MESLNFLKFFLKLYFEAFRFGLVMFDSFDPKADMHIANMKQRMSDVIFKMSRLELCLSLLKIPKVLFNFILTLDRFPCGLNLIEGSILRLVGRNIISSVFCIFRHNLLALNQYDRFNRFLFICFPKTSKDIFDSIIVYKRSYH